MSTLKVGAIQSTTGNAAVTVANNGNLTIPGNLSVTGTGGGTRVLMRKVTITSNTSSEIESYNLLISSKFI